MASETDSIAKYGRSILSPIQMGNSWGQTGRKDGNGSASSAYKASFPFPIPVLGALTHMYNGREKRLHKHLLSRNTT